MILMAGIAAPEGGCVKCGVVAVAREKNFPALIFLKHPKQELLGNLRAEDLLLALNVVKMRSVPPANRICRCSGRDPTRSMIRSHSRSASSKREPTRYLTIDLPAYPQNSFYSLLAEFPFRPNSKFF